MIAERPLSIEEILRSIRWPDIQFFPGGLEVDTYVEHLGPGYRMTQLLHNGLVMVTASDIEVEENPEPHDEFTDQVYWIKGHRLDGNVFMVGELRAGGGKTSTHQHPEGMFEIYRIYAGEYHLKLGEKGREQTQILRGNPLHPAIGIVPSHTLHHGETQEHPALVVLCMVGAANVPEEEWHKNRRR